MNAIRLKRILILIISLLTVFVTIQLELFLQRKQNLIGAGINRAFLFLLINLHVIIITFFLYVIIRQSIKLFLEWHRSIPGSVFKRNLLFAFTLFSVIPSLFVFFTAGKFISTSIDDWFRTHISKGLKNSLLLHKNQTESLRNQISKYGQIFVNGILSKIPINSIENQDSIEKITTEFEDFKKNHPVTKNYTLYIWSLKKGLIGSIKDEIKIWRHYRKHNDRTTHQLNKEFFYTLKNIEKEKPFDFYGSLYWTKQIANIYFILVFRYPPLIRYPLIKIQNSISDYQQLKSMRNQIYLIYFCTFTLITLLILLLSIWCAFYFARGLGEPIHELTTAMIQVRNGNRDIQINSHPENDLRHLTLGFNEMTSALKSAHIQLKEKNREMMLILENIRAAVFLINKFGKIITLNPAAQQFVLVHFNLSICINKRISIFGKEIKDKIIKFARESIKSQKKYFFKEISLNHQGEDKTLMIHFTKINLEHTPQGSEKGLLLVIEDLTEIVKFNTIKTWQEAAKQVAHEIKNPLTPIQLASQHLQRKYNQILDNDQVFLDCTQTILNQVQIIKDLVSHFATFASMPHVSLEQTDLNSLITDVIRLYQIGFPKINFVSALNSTLPQIMLDKKKMHRVFTNLIDNSIKAIQKENFYSNYKPFIKIQTQFLQKQNKVEILFTDNGPGIPKPIQSRLFIPYVSTERKNMGLGLAIVREIIEQMHGKIKLNQIEKGTQFKIELPFH